MQSPYVRKLLYFSCPCVRRLLYCSCLCVHRLLYYCVVGGEEPWIELAAMTGKNPRKLASTDLGAPSGLTVDPYRAAGRLYWADAKLNRVETALWDGSRRTVLARGRAAGGLLIGEGYTHGQQTSGQQLLTCRSCVCLYVQSTRSISVSTACLAWRLSIVCMSAVRTACSALSVCLLLVLTCSCVCCDRLPGATGRV